MAINYRKKLVKLGIEVIHELTHKGAAFGYYCRVPCILIFPGPEQRPLDPNHIKKLGGKGKFDPLLAGTAALSFRESEGKSIWNCDGQHRQKLASLSDVQSIYANVYVGLSVEKEADLFFNLNDSPKRMNGWVKFKAALNGGNIVYKSLLTLCDKYKLTTPLSPKVSANKDADIPSAEYLLFAEKHGGCSLVEALCRVFKECWSVKGRVRHDAKQTALVRGLVLFLKEFYHAKTNPLPWATIKMVLTNIKPEHITTKAKQQEATRTDSHQYYQAFCDTFGRSKDKLVSPGFRQRKAA